MKIITAIGNPYINNKLRENSDYEIIGRDIQYQEGILEIIEVKKDIDVIILSNNLPVEIEFEELINQIIKLKNDIEIIVFLKEKNLEIEQFLNSKKVYKIYYLNDNYYDIFLNNFCKNIKKTREEIATEIKDFKGLILKKNSINIDKNSEKNLEKNFIKKQDGIVCKNNIINANIRKINLKKINVKQYKRINHKSEINKICNKKYDGKIIAVSGAAGVGKSIFCCFLSKYIKKENKKILLIDLDDNNSINTILGTKTNNEKNINEISSNIYILSVVNSINLEEYNIFGLLDNLKDKFDFIIIDTSIIIKKKLNQSILRKVDKIIFLVIPNLLEIKKSKNLLEIYNCDMNIDENKIKIIFNKCSNNSISRDILEEIFYKYEILEFLKYDEQYMYYINKNLNVLPENNEYKKIYESLEMEEKCQN